MEESHRIWGILFPRSNCSYKKQSCDHCRDFSRPDLVFPTYRSYMDLIQAILTKLAHIFCVVSHIDFQLFLSVRFMTIHLDHKHELSLQTVASFKVVTTPQPAVHQWLFSKSRFHPQFCQPVLRQVPQYQWGWWVTSVKRPKGTYKKGIGTVTCCWMVTNSETLNLHLFQQCWDRNCSLLPCSLLNLYKQIWTMLKPWLHTALCTVLAIWIWKSC